MKINCRNLELLNSFTDISVEKFCISVAAVGQSKLDELSLIPAKVLKVDIALTFLAPDKIQKINMQYRQVDAPTDVLSFPIWEDKNGKFMPPQDWEELPLGDLLVCPECVAKNANDNGKRFDQELALVLFHGMLHLCGYDHDTKERQAEMWQLQDEMVGKLNV